MNRNNLQSTGLWTAGMVMGYVMWWPVGLAINMYMLVAGKFDFLMKANNNNYLTMMGIDKDMFNFTTNNSTGNSAFDTYREETLRRLEEDQKEFTNYLERLRLAKDQTEFNLFMQERNHSK